MTATVTILALWATGCGYQRELSMAGSAAPEEAEMMNDVPDRFAKVVASPDAAAEPMVEQARAAGSVGAADDGDIAGLALDGVMRGAGGENAPAPPPPPTDPAGRDDGGAQTRRWFPEAFLWQPLVQTGDDGTATVQMTVPDQLTTWRLLGLAHDREGQQAGTVLTFDSRLPVYVDPVVPGWLMAGDRLVLPVQAVNSTANTVSARLVVQASGAIRARGSATVSLTAGSSDVRNIPMEVSGAGQATVTASLQAGDASDAAERTIPVMPSGRPLQTTRSSTLSSSRTFRLPPPPRASAVTEELEVLVFPGPLAVLQAEVERLQSGARPTDGAYGFALATHLQTLAGSAGVEVDPAVLRKLMVVAWQRTVGQTRSPDGGQAADLLAALQQVTGHELVQGVVPRLQQVLFASQRADGTWSRRATSTLPRVLVDTAVAARALPESAEGPRLRAMGAVERYARDVEDPFTAAAVLASGLAQGPQAEHLLTLVTDALVQNASTGAWSVAVPGGALDAWDRRPSRATMLAFTVLALPPSHEARGDLVSELMGGWDAARGFGAGAADVWALQAIVSALPGAAQKVDLSLSLDGTPVATTTLDPAQPMVAGVLQARPEGRDAEITLTVTPQVPGLSFVATRRSWVPWSASDRIEGVDVDVRAQRLVRGEGGQLQLTAAAPSGSVLVIEQPLPAGTTVAPDAQVRAQAVGATLDTFADRVRLTTRPFQAGEILELSVPVVPAFAGRFATPPLTVAVDAASPVPLRPVVWQVATR